jgi:hypothetical protein
MTEKEFEQILPELNAIDTRKTSYPKIPVATALQEAEDLFVWCQEDKAQLERAGLNWQIPSGLPKRAAVCRYLQSLWEKETKIYSSVQREWKQKSTEGFALRNELLRHFNFAFRNHPGILSQVKLISKGSSNADMIQDLSDLAALGTEHSKYLQSIGIDPELFRKAGILLGELAVLLAKYNGEMKEGNYKMKVLRNKAFLYLKEAMDEIRETGKYVFRNDDERYRGYISYYYKKHNQHAKIKRKVDSQTVPVEQEGSK